MVESNVYRPVDDISLQALTQQVHMQGLRPFQLFQPAIMAAHQSRRMLITSSLAVFLLASAYSASALETVQHDWLENTLTVRYAISPSLSL